MVNILVHGSCVLYEYRRRVTIYWHLHLPVHLYNGRICSNLFIRFVVDLLHNHT